MIKETIYRTRLQAPYLKAKLAKLLKFSNQFQEVPGHLTPVESIALSDRVKGLVNGSIVLEIGSYLGRSSSLICDSLPKDAKPYCIDTWQNDAMSEGNWDTYEIFVTNMHRHNQRYEALRGRSEEIAKNWNQQIDFLWIDGDHSFEGCYSDLVSWYPFLKPGGWVGLHDFLHPCGVRDAVNNYFNGESKKYYFGGSILMLRK